MTGMEVRRCPLSLDLLMGSVWISQVTFTLLMALLMLYAKWIDHPELLRLSRVHFLASMLLILRLSREMAVPRRKRILTFPMAWRSTHQATFTLLIMVTAL